VVAFAEVYIDESGTHDGSPVLCVAGYLFRKRNAVKFAKVWGRILAGYGLPYFRMSDCAHGNGPFAGMDSAKRTEIEKRLIQTIHACAEFGFSITVNEADYEAIVTQRPDIGGAYSFCLHGCLAVISNWRKRTGFRGEIAYFFESGHRDQGQANRIMVEIFTKPAARERMAYGSHSFVDKSKVVPLQPADMLAWLWRNNQIRKLNKVTTSRKDLVALVRPDNKTINYWSELLPQINLSIQQHDGWGF
jgi:hypothetical protein